MCKGINQFNKLLVGFLSCSTAIKFLLNNIQYWPEKIITFSTASIFVFYSLAFKSVLDWLQVIMSYAKELYRILQSFFFQVKRLSYAWISTFLNQLINWRTLLRMHLWAPLIYFRRVILSRESLFLTSVKFTARAVGRAGNHTSHRATY